MKQVDMWGKWYFTDKKYVTYPPAQKVALPEKNGTYVVMFCSNNEISPHEYEPVLGTATWQDGRWAYINNRIPLGQIVFCWADLSKPEIRQPLNKCPYCGGKAVRKQIYFAHKDGEDVWKCEHHEDGSLKWSYLECGYCHRKTKAYCYEIQSEKDWNAGKISFGEQDKDN